MNIAIDIDDTLTDSFDYFQPFVAEFFGADLNDLKSRRISYGNLPDEWKSRELEFCKKYYDATAALTPFKPDAKSGVDALKSAGHRIIIITGRTNAFYSDPYKTTRQELANGRIEYDKLICTLDKNKACADEQIDILIDDMPANCSAAEKVGVKPILFTSKANSTYPSPFDRAESWQEVLKIIKNYAQEKKYE